MNRITETRSYINDNGIEISWNTVRELLKSVDGLSSNAFDADIESFLMTLESELSYYLDNGIGVKA